MHRLLTLNPDNDSIYVRLHIHPVGKHWAAMIVGDTVLTPVPGEVKGLGFLGATADEAERLAKAYLGMGEPAN